MANRLRFVVVLVVAGAVLAPLTPSLAQGIPAGTPRSEKEFAADFEEILYARRIAHSDLLSGGLREAYKVKGCVKCHENSAQVEGQIFYGPAFKDFAKDQKTKNRAIVEKRLTPGRDYDFAKAHDKRQKLWIGEVHEQIIKQNQ